VDNLTHSLVGAALAELTLPADAPRATRRTFFITGVLAANLPDADLLYTRITAPPIGYLLHHRGHTHTLGGIVVLGLAIAAVGALPKIRESVGAARNRFWLLIALALTSHLVLDWWNSYGVHPFWPLSSRWFYGDAVYILEPWLWMLLGVAATLNTQRRFGGALLGGFIVVLLALGTWMHVIARPALALLLVVAAALVALARSWAPPRRSAVALALSALFVSFVFAMREVARAEVAAAPAELVRRHRQIGDVAVDRVTFPPRRPVDLVLSSQAANPLCWNAVSITRDETVYAMTRGTVAVIIRNACGAPRAESVQWEATQIQSLARLRTLDATDCWARAWLQFGRAPEIGGNVISDVRYSDPGRPNFTTMPLRDWPTGTCPRHLTAWRPPRADLLQAGQTP
jgi:inner membrane protein